MKLVFEYTFAAPREQGVSNLAREERWIGLEGGSAVRRSHVSESGRHIPMFQVPRAIWSGREA